MNVSLRRLGQALWLSMAIAAVASAQAAQAPVHTDSRAPYVHRLTLYDAQGVAINPADPRALPYSPRATCGKCHDYEKISSGWHFAEGDEGVPGSGRGEPWIMVDAPSRTQIPLSGRAWPGTYTLGEAGLTAWDFVLKFGSHMPGGGWGERFADTDSPRARWAVSGKAEIDCLLCHNADNSHDPAERYHQIIGENLKWIPAASAGLAVVRGQARRQELPTTLEVLDPEARQAPSYVKVVYNRALFDADDRVLMNITRRPSPGRCYYCHSSRQVGPDALPQWQVDQDVHIAKGMVCVDCHRNGLDHQIVRGREDTPDQADPLSTSLTCRGCHVGSASAGNRMGAPRPRHAGLPPLHLERLSCTACHSGPLPSSRTGWVQTSMAHGLGVPSDHRRDDAMPHIAEPVLIKGLDGRIAPHRVLWPSFWGRLEGQRVVPIDLGTVAAKAREVLEEGDLRGSLPLGGDQIERMLVALSGGPGMAVYVRGGKAYRLGEDGKLTEFSSFAAQPYYWPLAHDVRPAAQSLGAGGDCRQCHSLDAPFLFGQVRADASPEESAARPMFEYQGQPPFLTKMLAVLFSLRSCLRLLGFSACAVTAGVLALYGLGGLSSLLRRVERKHRDWTT